MSFCSKCGKQIEEQVSFCPHCGNANQTQTPPAIPSNPQQSPVSVALSKMQRKKLECNERVCRKYWLCDSIGSAFRNC